MGTNLRILKCWSQREHRGRSSCEEDLDRLLSLRIVLTCYHICFLTNELLVKSPGLNIVLHFFWTRVSVTNGADSELKANAHSTTTETTDT